MLNLTSLHANHVVRVLFWEHLTILDWLNRGMIMVLVDLSVNGSLSLLMTVLANFLIHDGGSHLLMDGGVMVTSLLPRQESVSKAST